MGSTATILHADLDAFYASVEQLLDPRLRGKPIAVGGGVVLAASYEARAFGIRSGMPGRLARQLCPDLVFVGGHFDEYQRLGDAAIAVLSNFTPAIERISIDEAFADVAGCTHLFGSPEESPERFGLAYATSLACRCPSAWRVPSTSPRSHRRSLSRMDWSSSIQRRNSSSFTNCQWRSCGAWAPPPRRDSPRTASRLSVNWPRALLNPWRGCWGTRWEESWRHSRGTAIRGKSRPIGARTPAGAQSALGRQPAIERVFKPTLHHLADRIAGRLRASLWRAGRSRSVVASLICALSRAR